MPFNARSRWGQVMDDRRLSTLSSSSPRDGAVSLRRPKQWPVAGKPRLHMQLGPAANSHRPPIPLPGPTHRPFYGYRSESVAVKPVGISHK